LVPDVLAIARVEKLFLFRSGRFAGPTKGCDPSGAEQHFLSRREAAAVLTLPIHPSHTHQNVFQRADVSSHHLQSLTETID